MEKLIIETPAQWLKAQQVKQVARRLKTITMPPLYVKEEVVYEFYKWSTRKALVSGVAIGLAIAVTIAVTVKLMGV